jgi:hypothetical protein
MAGMVDWFGLLANGLWILGLAVLLAAVSYHAWEAEVRGRPLREQLGGDQFGWVAWLSLVLVGLGLALTSDRVWEMVIWGVFVLAAGYYGVKSWRGALGDKEGTQGNSGELRGTQEEEELSIVNSQLSIVHEEGNSGESGGTQGNSRDK